MLYPQHLEQGLTCGERPLIFMEWMKDRGSYPWVFQSICDLAEHYIELWCRYKYNCRFAGRGSVPFSGFTGLLVQEPKMLEITDLKEFKIFF